MQNVTIQVTDRTFRDFNRFLDTPDGKFGQQYIKYRSNPYLDLGVVTDNVRLSYIARPVLVYAPRVSIDRNNPTVDARWNDLANHGIFIAGSQWSTADFAGWAVHVNNGNGYFFVP
jgi:hypothetical protein